MLFWALSRRQAATAYAALALYDLLQRRGALPPIIEALATEDGALPPMDHEAVAALCAGVSGREQDLSTEVAMLLSAGPSDSGRHQEAFGAFRERLQALEQHLECGSRSAALQVA